MLSAETRKLLGIALRAVREEKRLTQGELAEDVGITQEQVSRIERGISEPSPDEISLWLSAVRYR